MKRLFRSNRKSQRGSALVELAMTLGITIFLIFGFFEMVMMVYTYSVLSDAAKEGVRYAVVHGADNGVPSGPGNTGGVVTAVNTYAQLSMHDISSITITPTYPDGDNLPSHRVQVDVIYNYVPYISLPYTNLSIHTTAAGRIVY
jgi:hypothetical protein